MSWDQLSDPLIVKKIGEGIKQLRLNKNMSQAQIAQLSGLDRTTISRMESGRAATMLTMVQVLRVLDELPLLDAFIREPEISPLQLLQIQEKYRKRASKRKKPEDNSEW